MSQQIKICIADDHQMFIDGLCEILSHLDNIEVVATVNNGVQLLEQMKSLLPDLILMDVNMPEMDGVEATKQVVSTYPEVKVLMLTMFDSRDYIRKVLKAGAHGYLLKNTGKQELQAAIEAVMKGESFFSAAVTKTIMDDLQNKNTQSNNVVEVELTERELDVLKLIAQEMTTNEIAEELFISKHTVETHRKNLISKLNVRNIAGLVKYAVQRGLVD